MELAFRKTVDLPYAAAVERTREILQEHGFGVITEVDVKATIREKLDKDFRRYIILGACNPGFAHQALEMNLDVGLFLPCNVIVYEEGEKSRVAALNPDVMAEALKDSGFRELGRQVGQRLSEAVNAL